MDTHRYRGKMIGDTGRMPSTSQGVPEATWASREVWNVSFLTTLGRNQPYQHLDFGLLDFKTVANKFLLFKAQCVVLCYAALGDEHILLALWSGNLHGCKLEQLYGSLSVFPISEITVLYCLIASVFPVCCCFRWKGKSGPCHSLAGSRNPYLFDPYLHGVHYHCFIFLWPGLGLPMGL